MYTVRHPLLSSMERLLTCNIDQCLILLYPNKPAILNTNPFPVYTTANTTKINYTHTVARVLVNLVLGISSKLCLGGRKFASNRHFIIEDLMPVQVL